MGSNSLSFIPKAVVVRKWWSFIFDTKALKTILRVQEP